MEIVPGRSVQDYMDVTGPLEIDETLAVVNKCCLGLAYIHYHGVIRRDIKPGNIMYHPAQGIAKLMEFSVAHRIEEPPVRDTGTIAHMAPEHFDRERRITLLTDIFALGSTMYRLLTGKYPFERQHTASQILHQDPEPIESLRGDIPEPVAKLVRKATAKADSDRFQSAAEFATAVETVARRLFPNSEWLDASGKYMTG